jgi:hypothetical protein
MDDPADWKEAIDPSSGNVYYYHRKTRESCWERPACLWPLANQVQSPSQSNTTDLRELAYGKDGIYDKVPSLTAVNEVTSLISKIEMISPKEAREGDLKALSEYVTLPLLEWIFEQTQLLTNLVNIAIHTKQRVTRQYALHCLWSMTLCRNFNAQYFHTEQSWPLLFEHVKSWTSDPESVLFLGSIAVNLLIGPTRALVSDNAKDDLCAALQDISVNVSATLASTVLQTLSTADSEATLAILDVRALHLFAAVASKGQQVPARLIISIFQLAFKTSNYAVDILERDGLTILINITSNNRLKKEIRDAARRLLLVAMRKSEHAMERVLDAHIDLVSVSAAGVGHIPMGPLPALYSSCFLPSTYSCGAEDKDLLQRAVMATAAQNAVDSLDDEPDEISGVETLVPDMIELGYFDIDEVQPLDEEQPPSESEQLQKSMQRDIEWT